MITKLLPLGSIPEFAIVVGSWGRQRIFPFGGNSLPELVDLSDEIKNKCSALVNGWKSLIYTQLDE